jgi:hypothetical protein
MISLESSRPLEAASFIFEDAYITATITASEIVAKLVVRPTLPLMTHNLTTWRA